MSWQQTAGSAASPIEFLDKMTSFAFPCVAFILAVIAIIVMQVLFFKTDKLVFILVDLGLGMAGMISALFTMNYYSTFNTIFEANKAYMTMAQLEMCPNISFYTVACIFFALGFIGSLFVTMGVFVVKKFIIDR